MVIRVRLPAVALRHYLQPSPGERVSGRVLSEPVRRETLLPAGIVFASSRDADLVELPVQVDPGDMAQGLRPGDSVQVLAAYTEGARRGRAVVLLPSAEVVRVLQDPAGLAGTGQERGVQLRMPSDRAPIVVAAIATARIFVVKAPGLGPEPAATDPPEGSGPGDEPGPAGDEPGPAGDKSGTAGSEPASSGPRAPDPTNSPPDTSPDTSPGAPPDSSPETTGSEPAAPDPGVPGPTYPFSSGAVGM